jgi:hypothetical protein
LPLKLKLVSPGSVEQRRTAVLYGPQIQEPPLSPLSSRLERKDPIAQLVNRIDVLEQKIDQLLALILKEQLQEARDKAVLLEIHGEGLLFRWPEEIVVGRVIELDLELALMPPTDIRCLAKVQRCEPEPQEQVDPDAQRHFIIETQFLEISEAGLDQIHRFILTTQRQERRRDRIEREKSQDE